MGPRWGKINLSTDSGCSAAENSVSCFEIIFPHLLRVAQLKKACEMANKKRPGGGFPAHLRGGLKNTDWGHRPRDFDFRFSSNFSPPPFSKLQPHPVFLAAYLSDDKAKAIFNVGYQGGLLRSSRPPAGPVSYIRPKGC